MARRIQEYRSDELVVTFDPSRCIHAAFCLRGAPAVFDVRRREWIRPEAGTADEIAGVIERCPSGALQYHRLDGKPDEQPDAEASARTVRNGPLYVRGRLELRTADGEVIAEGTRFALCRCGQSQNKPFCDNSHRAAGFVAD